MNNENLIPYPKGTSGNINGRPKGAKSMTSILKKILDKNIKHHCKMANELKEAAVIEHIACSLIASALEGDVRAIREIYDRVDGKTDDANINIVTDQLRFCLTKEQIDEIVRVGSED